MAIIDVTRKNIAKRSRLVVMEEYEGRFGITPTNCNADFQQAHSKVISEFFDCSCVLIKTNQYSEDV